MVTIHVNGQQHRVEVEPETPLLLVLRNDLGLKAAKFACGFEQCGACKVLIDGKPAPSCRRPVGSVQECNITTLEGLASDECTQIVQRAFIAEQAAQCGYCTSGMVMAAVCLLRQHAPASSSSPSAPTQPLTDAEIRAEMARHLCRCGVYPRVLRAIRRAAQEMGSE